MVAAVRWPAQRTAHRHARAASGAARRHSALCIPGLCQPGAPPGSAAHNARCAGWLPGAVAAALAYAMQTNAPHAHPRTSCSPLLAAIGRLCEKCDGKCPICDSYVRPATLVRVCDECNYGSYEGRCVICGGVGVSDAYYCKECTAQEKDVSHRRGGWGGGGLGGPCAWLPAWLGLPAWLCPGWLGANVEAGACSTQSPVRELCPPRARSPERGRQRAAALQLVRASQRLLLHPMRPQRDGCPKIINLGSAKTE